MSALPTIARLPDPGYREEVVSRKEVGSGAHSVGYPAVSPRLLNLQQTADYLGCSYWTARDWTLAGLIPVVELPPLRTREGERPRKSLRRVLVDRADLDAFIEARKHPVQPLADRREPARAGQQKTEMPASRRLEG